MERTFYQFQEEERAESFYNWYVTAILLNDPNLSNHAVTRGTAEVYFSGTKAQQAAFHASAQAYEAAYGIGKRKGMALERKRLELCAQA